MREIVLAKGRGIALVDDEDFDSLTRNSWSLSSAGYAIRGGGCSPTVLMHRQILGFPARLHVDHIDRYKLNNTRANLRACTSSQNHANRLRKTGGVFKGVWRHGRLPNRWQAEIRVDGVRHHLGLHRSPEGAARAYDAAAREHFGEFARLNFPIGDEQAA